MEYKYVYLKKAGNIATIYLNRPSKRNALNYEMWLSIIKLTHECEEDSNIKVVIYRGIDNSAFSAGADIGEFKTLRYTTEGAAKYNQATLDAEKAIMHCTKPTIAMVQGICVGGGCEISLACDFRFSDYSGLFGITPAKLGLVYNLPGTKNLVDLVGPSNAKDLLYTGRLLEAAEAKEIGLINRVFHTKKLEEETYKYAEIISNNAQLSIRGSKQIIAKVLEGEKEDTVEIGNLVLNSFESTDYREGVNAFLEKREAKFELS